MIRPGFAIAAFVVASAAFANATIPKADIKGSKDNPLLKRYEGSYIVSREQQGFAEFTLPLSRLEKVEGKKDGRNNTYHEPKEKKALEGVLTRLVYVIPEDRSPLEVLRNYQDELKAKGGKVLFECKGEDCGGDPHRSNSGGGGRTSLAMYLYPKNIADPAFSNGYCAMTGEIDDQRYIAAEIPDAGAHVSVLTYATIDDNPHGACKALNKRTIAVVDIVEAKEREKKMVTVQADAMAKAIANTGSVALYGIFFDFNKADVKSESDATLEQIAKLLKGSAAMKLLVVGHTDNVGSFASNTELSQRRATAVVSALSTRFGIARDRLTPVGVSFASPVAPNTTEDGRAKNRRVELVDNPPATKQ